MATTPDDWTPNYSPDADASAMDREVMALAARLHGAGWPDEAFRVASAMAEIREAARNPLPQSDGTLHGLRDLLAMVSDSAASIVAVIDRSFPDDLALRSPR